MSSGPNSPQHLPLTLSLKCQWCFRGRTQNQKCSRRLWRNSVGEKKEKNSKKPVSRQERRQQQQQLITSSCNTRPPLVVLPWRPAGGRPMAWPPSNTVRSGVFQGQEVTCSRSVYQNNPLCKWIMDETLEHIEQPGCVRWESFTVAAVGSYQRAERDDLEDWFHEEEGGKHNVEVLQDFIIRFRCTVKLEGHKKKEVWVSQTPNFPLLYRYSEVFYGVESCECLYLHHKDDGVERNQSHDAVLEGRRNYKLPHAILEAEFILRHVASQRPGVDGEIYTGSLWEGRKRELCLRYFKKS